jgi:hypothetical protein
VSGVKRHAPNEWYSPYFAPTTVIIAITVLIVSVEAGRYVGNYFVQRDLSTAATTPVTYAAPAHGAPTKAAAHRSRSPIIHATPGKNQP